MAFRRHPYARKWRNRPAVTIIGGSPAQKHTYRKIRSGPHSLMHGETVAFIPDEVIIGKSAISDAIKLFNGNTSMIAVECYPVIQQAQTIRELFATYRIFAASPFVAVRSGLGIISPSTLWPIIAKHSPLTMGYVSTMYMFFSWTAKWVNAFVVLYSLYLALNAGYSGLFMTYIVGFSLWMSWAIVMYPELSIRYKISYLLLFPVSFIYFMYLALLAPLRVGPLVTAIRHHRWSAKIEL